MAPTLPVRVSPLPPTGTASHASGVPSPWPPARTKKKTTTKKSIPPSARANREHRRSTDEELDAEAQSRTTRPSTRTSPSKTSSGWTSKSCTRSPRPRASTITPACPKQDLIFKILQTHIAGQGLMYGEGVLEILPDGFGFLRSPEYSYLACPDDIYVSPAQIRRFGLKVGHVVQGTIRPPKESERYFALLRVDAVNGRAPTQLNDLIDLRGPHPAAPRDRFVLETPTRKNIEMRDRRPRRPRRQGAARPSSSPRPAPARPSCSRRWPSPSSPTTPTCKVMSC